MTFFMPSFATQQLLPPWYSKAARNWAFIIPIDPQCIQNYLDVWLNSKGPDQAPYYWKAMPAAEHGYGVLMVCDHTDFSSIQDGEPGWERLKHREVLWIFPAYRYERTADNLLVGQPTITWIQPFALDDNSFVMFSSREIWGCEKDMATIQLEQGKAADPLDINIALQGCKVFNPRSISHLIGVMKISMKHPEKPFDHQDWERDVSDPNLAGMLGHFLAGIAGPTRNPKTRQPLKPNKIEINTLKQFRDAFDLRYAAYRGIVASSVTHDEVSTAQFHSGEDITIDFMWSDTCAERWTQLFGLTPPTFPPGYRDLEGQKLPPANVIDWDMPSVRGKVTLAVSFTADTTFEVLDTLFTYGLPSGS